MHDLVRLYATETAHHDLAEDVRMAALRRVIDFYTHTAHIADRVLYPQRQPIHLDPPAPGVHTHSLSDGPAALAWFAAEHPVLLTAQHTATSHAWHAAVWQLAWTLNTFHVWRGHRHDRLTLWQAALHASEHLPDPTSRIVAHRFLGDTLATLGRHEEGIMHLRQALALAEEPYDTYQQARIHRGLAFVWEQQGDYREALAHATYARDLHRVLDQPVWEADALNAMGWYAAQLGEYDTAFPHCRAALALHRHHHHSAGEASTQDSLGYIAHHTGHYQQAVGCYRQALTLRRILGHTWQTADTLDNLGRPYAALAQFEQARTVWREALDLYRQEGRTQDAERVQQELDTLSPNPPIGSA
jgi:tetratricopeptide (TPR) repeat protein